MLSGPSTPPSGAPLSPPPEGTAELACDAFEEVAEGGRCRGDWTLAVMMMVDASVDELAGVVLPFCGGGPISWLCRE